MDNLREKTQINTLPKYHAFVNENRPPHCSDYENFNIEWSPQDNYQVVKRIGRGKYSDVFQGMNVANGKFCAIKILKPVRKLKIKREIKILQNVSGSPNIIQLLDVCLNPSAEIPSLVFEYLENRHFRILYPSFDDFEMRLYLFKLLTAIDHTHREGIIHRDIKPNNVIFDVSTKELRLIDWGLADFYRPDASYNVHVSTLYFKPPELLLSHPFYHYTIDMWSFGCVMAGIMFGAEPFFKGRDNDSVLLRIIELLGNKEFFSYVRKYDMKLSKELERKAQRSTRKGFECFAKTKNVSKITAEGLDLLSKILVIDHQERIYAHEALEHPFFDSVRANNAY